MADAYTTTSTLAGLMKTLVPDTQAQFATTPSLLGAVTAVEAQGSKTVQFPAISTSTRTTEASDHTEGTDMDSTAITISAKSAALAAKAVLAKVSNLAMLGGLDISLYVSKILAGQVANAIDAEIAGVISANMDDSSHVAALEGSMTLSLLSQAVATIRGDGYTGKLVACFHPKQYWGSLGLSSSLVASTSAPPANAVTEEMMRAGWVNNVMGVDIYVSHRIDTHVDTSDTYAYGAVFAQEVVGLGYHNPIIDVQGGEDLDALGVKIVAAAYIKGLLLDDDGGYYRLDTKIIDA
jgi:hypothetical protein